MPVLHLMTVLPPSLAYLLLRRLDFTNLSPWHPSQGAGAAQLAGAPLLLRHPGRLLLPLLCDRVPLALLQPDAAILRGGRLLQLLLHGEAAADSSLSSAEGNSRGLRSLLLTIVYPCTVTCWSGATTVPLDGYHVLEGAWAVRPWMKKGVRRVACVCVRAGVVLPLYHWMGATHCVPLPLLWCWLTGSWSLIAAA